MEGSAESGTASGAMCPWSVYQDPYCGRREASLRRLPERKGTHQDAPWAGLGAEPCSFYCLRLCCGRPPLRLARGGAGSCEATPGPGVLGERCLWAEEPVVNMSQYFPNGWRYCYDF